jgi:hypothetical protein
LGHERVPQAQDAAAITSLGISHAEFHVFRHSNISLRDAFGVSLKTIQERIGHGFTGSFPLELYGGKPDWSANVERFLETSETSDTSETWFLAPVDST